MQRSDGIAGQIKVDGVAYLQLNGEPHCYDPRKMPILSADLFT